MQGASFKHRGYVLVVDFGGQYAHLIARRIRELGVYTELVSAYTSIDQVVSLARTSWGVVLSGGPGSVWESEFKDLALRLVETGKPLLGICFGHQLLASVLGGHVGPAPKPEYGPTTVEILASDPLFKGVPRRIRVWMSHHDSVLGAPPGSRVLARSPGSPVAAFKLGRVYGVQWHPEVVHTEYGPQLLSNWLTLIGAERGWRPENLVESLVEEVRRAIGNSKAIVAVSGGVDSTTAAVIAYRAIGDRLRAVLIDHGMHPLGEPEYSLRLLEKAGLKPVLIDAREEFLSALQGVSGPEEKRRLFGRLYAGVLKREAEEWGAEYLVQGTIYPDVIESGGRPGASLIKSHHNVAGLPRELGLDVVEPLKWFYKDEVRRIARVLGVPEEIVYRQPIPGPALAVRIEGEVTREKLEVVRKADAIVREEIEKRGLHRSLWQYFAVLTSSKATGVKGDERAYGYAVVVRAVESQDGMTASPARLPWEALEAITWRITSEIPQVTRVVYDLTPKPPATIEWE